MRYAVIAILIFLILCFVFSWATDTHRFVVRHYRCRSDRIKKNMRLALIADLHNKEYDKGNTRIINAIDNEHPDAVVIAGDLLNGLVDSDYTPALELVRNLSLRYPVYYGMGNHEYRLKIYPEHFGDMWSTYNETVEKCGVHIMDNERILLDEYGIDIAAVTIGREYYKKLSRRQPDADDIAGYVGDASSDNMQILIAHNPEFFHSYAEWGADLTLSGHVHGGVMRLPFIGGVISPRFTLFPRYSGGEYDLGAHKLIVSCGLGMHTINIRIFNPGELAVIDIYKD